MNIFSLVIFEIREKFLLRNFQGVGRATNFSNSTRNEEFYKKIKKEIAPILEDYGYQELRKRRFVKEEQQAFSFIEFNLTKKLNAVKICYGKIAKEKINEEKLTDFHSLCSYGLIEKDWFVLKPHFWRFEYEYPVLVDSINDHKKTAEILHLLTERVLTNQK